MKGTLDRVSSFVEKVLSSQPGFRNLAVPESECRLGSLLRPRNLLCIGLNYRDHAAEGGIPIPENPVVFAKLTGCAIGPSDSIVLPRGSQQVDYEAELAVVIGRRCRGVSVSEALEYVGGYTCLNE